MVKICHHNDPMVSPLSEISLDSTEEMPTHNIWDEIKLEENFDTDILGSHVENRSHDRQSNVRCNDPGPFVGFKQW